MMYDIIGQELRSQGISDLHPQDYLNFYCLGNREAPPSEMPGLTNPPDGNNAAVRH